MEVIEHHRNMIMDASDYEHEFNCYCKAEGYGLINWDEDEPFPDIPPENEHLLEDDGIVYKFVCH